MEKAMAHKNSSKIQNKSTITKGDSQYLTIFQEVFENANNCVGQAFLENLTKALAKTLGVKFAFISEEIDEKTLKTVTFFKDDQFLPNFEYLCHGTPCEVVKEKGMACFQNQVQNIFPDDKFLINEHVNSYYAISFGRTIKGHMGIMDVDPIVKSDFVKTVLMAFTDRAGIELERSKLERSLNDNLEKINAIMYAAKDGIITINEEGSIESFNPAIERIFGYTKKELVGKSIYTLVPAHYKNDYDDLVKKYLKSNDSQIWESSHELVGLTKSKKIIPIELSLSQFELGGQSFYTGVVRDISRRKKLEKEILEIRDKERKEIGMNLHDGPLQTLAGLKLICHSVFKSKAVEGNEELLNKLSTIRNSFDKSIDEIKSIVNILVPEETMNKDIPGVFHGIINQVEEMYKIPCTLAYDQDIQFKDDTTLIHFYYIAKEAIINAVKHSQAKRIKVSFTKENNQIVLKVSDDGIGIAQNSDHHDGRGLFIMRDRAARIGAVLSINSHPGKGTKIICKILNA